MENQYQQSSNQYQQYPILGIIYILKEDFSLKQLFQQNQLGKNNFVKREYKTIEFKNGYYQGYLLNNQRDGLGLYFWDSGQIYFGFWENDVINGYGVLYFSKGGYFFGKFADGQANGYCQFVYQDGSSQQGIWKQGELQGKCIAFKNNEWKYEEYQQNQILVSSISQQAITQQMNLLSFLLEKIFNVNEETKPDQQTPVYDYAFILKHPIYNFISIEVNLQDETLFLLAHTNIQNNSFQSQYECGYGILHHNFKPLIRGFFMDGKLNGIGCVIQPGEVQYKSQINKGQLVDLDLQIHDGIFQDNQFLYGKQI